MEPCGRFQHSAVITKLRRKLLSTRSYTLNVAVGAENLVTSCDLQILVYQAAEAVSS